MMDFRDNLQKCQEYINALEEERKKINVFQRELPLCLELVTQAIDACKQQLSGTTTVTTECINGHSECSEQTTSDGPVYEEFIPLKRSHSTDDDEDELESNKPQHQTNNNLINSIDKPVKKSDWLRSVQLWNQTPDPPTLPEDHQAPKKVAVVEVKRNGNGGAFHPFQKEKSSSENGNGGSDHHHYHRNNNDDDDRVINTNNNTNKNNNVNVNINKPPTSTASACSSAHDEDMGLTSGGSGSGSGDGGSKKEEKGGQSQRKTRRCWSPELHRRFVHALQQLGGSHVATPKQIRDLMKVDGLTNDEVKSHLQKYRLHTRRPSSGVHNNNASSQAPQFVVVGGIWMPPTDYNAVSTAADTSSTGVPSSGIYTPIATVAAPPTHQTSTTVTQRQQSKQSTSQSQGEDRASHSEGRVRSNSPATSSSTHTTTASHAQ